MALSLLNGSPNCLFAAVLTSGVLAGLDSLLVVIFNVFYRTQLGMIFRVTGVTSVVMVGVMFMVVLGTFEWSSLRMLRKIPLTDAGIIFLVSAITVAADLAIAVIIGVIVSALVFAWKHAQHIAVTESFDEQGRKIYALRGPVFFGSVANFKELFQPENDPKEVIIDFARSRISDHSGIEALDGLAEKYSVLGKTLQIRHLSPECVTLLEKAGDLCEVNVLEDPHYHVATDKLG